MDSCCAPDLSASVSEAYRRVLWIALGVNASMFLVEVVAGVAAGSVALQADALDLFGDAMNYALSLSVLSMTLAWRARAALMKGVSMGLFGLWVMGASTYNAIWGAVPSASIMAATSLLVLVGNVAVAAMLYRYRDGDANMRSVWLCTRNDVIGNIAVICAAIGVFGTGTAWPDIAVAAIISSLAFAASWDVIRSARRELLSCAQPGPAT